MKKIRPIKSPLPMAFLCIVILFSFTACAERQTPASRIPTVDSSKTTAAPKVTFVELGATTCMPCKMMQPVMKNLEAKYPKDLKVVFYDVWTEAGKPAGQKYGIRAIPTQVFLDISGKEISRHEGFFPQAEIEKILKAHGVRE